MLITLTTILILTIAGIIWLVNRILPFEICPICAGVFGTWFGLLVAQVIGYNIDMIIPAILMGGSVVGMAYQIEKRLPFNRSSLFWKIIFIPAGFIVVYSLLIKQWVTAFILIILLILFVIFFFSAGKKNKSEINEKVEELKDKMKSCC